MSSNDPFPPLKKHKSNETCSGIKKSLFSRQLLSSFVITILGLSILSGLFYYTKQQSYIDDARITSLALDDYILGLMSYNEITERYYIDSENLNEANIKLGEYQLIGNDQYFSYIMDADNDVLIWHSQAMDSVNSNDASKPPYPLENLNALPKLKLKQLVNKGENNLEILPAKNLIKGIKKTDDGYYITYHSVFGQGSRNFYIVIAKSTQDMEKKESDLIQQIGILIFITSLLVLFSQFVSSYLVITPIKRFEHEIKDIESGKQEFIKGKFPVELLEVKGAINALVRVEKGQKKRYRESLDNLAHSLKTPLAVLQGFAESNNSLTTQQSATLVNQVGRMNDIIAYQLRRATISDHNANIKRQSIRPILYRLKPTFLKVHHSKSFNIEINVDENAECRMDTDDLMEVFGNLINNACRFCENMVSVTAMNNGGTIVIDIDDDGLGFPDKNPSTLLKRGMRADNKTEGQGIGMAVSNEIIQAAGGKMELLVSPYIGARVRLHLPV